MATGDNMEKAYQAALKNLDKLVSKQQALKQSLEGLNDSWNAISSEIFKIDGAQFFKQVPRSAKELKEMADTITEFEKNFQKAGEQFAKMIDKEGMSSKINEVGQVIKKELGDAFKNSTFESSAALTSYLDQLRSISPSLAAQIRDEQHLQQLLEGKAENQEDLLRALKEQKVFQDAELKFSNDYDKRQKIYKERLSEIKAQYSELNAVSDDQLVNLAEQISMTETLAGGALDWQKIVANSTPEQRKVLALLHGDSQAMLDINNTMNDATQAAEEMREAMLKPKDVFSLEKGFEALGQRMRKDMIGTILNFDEVINKVQRETSINMDDNSMGFKRLTTQVAQFGVSIEGAGEMMSDLSKELNTTNFSVLSKATADFAAIEGATGAASADIATIAGELMRMGESSGQVKNFMQEADQQARLFGVSSSKVLNGISKNIKRMRELGFTGGEKSLAKMAVTAERLRMNIDETFDMANKARSIEGALNMAAELQLAGGSFSNINPMDLLSAARKGPEELQKILGQMGKDIGRFDEQTGKYEFDPVDVDRLKMVSEATGQSMESLQNMIEKNAEDTEKLNPFQGMIDGIDEADKDLAKSTLADMMKRGADGKMMIDVDNDMAKKMGIDSLEDINSTNIEELVKLKKEDAKTIEEQNKRNQSLKQSFDNFINAMMTVFGIFEPFISVLTEVMQAIGSVFAELPEWSQTLIGGLMVAFGLFGTSVGSFITQGVGGLLKGGIGSLFGGKGKDVVSDAIGSSNVANTPGMDAQGGAEKKGFFTGLAQGIMEFGKIKWSDLLKFSASLVLIGGAIVGFTYALASAGGEASAAQWANAIGALVVLGGSILLMSKLFGQVDMGNVAKGALAMLLVGASLVPFAYAAQMMGDIDWGNVLAGVGVLGLVMVGLIAIGAIALSVGWMILAGAGVLALAGVAMMVASQGLLMSADAFVALGAIDWGAFSAMGGALMSVVPGMLGFAFASLAFANPLTIIGLMMMAGVLSGLSMVMTPLAISLDSGATSLDRFASGLDKLGAAADRLNLDKLEQLKELSAVLSNSAAMASVASNSSSNGPSTGSKSNSGGDVRKIEVDVKINGRDLQSFIVKDNKILT